MSGLAGMRPAGAASFTGLGVLPGGNFFHSEAAGVSADGRVVVGQSKSAAGQEAFRWQGGVRTRPSSVAVTAGETVFIVLKAKFLAGNDIYSIFVNPILDGVEPAPSASKTDFDPVPGSPLVGTNLTFNNYGYFSIDEIRIGTTYADVTPVGRTIPEPGSLALLGMGLVGLIGGTRVARPAVMRG